MADHDAFEDVSDGDTVSDGWFNGCVDEVEFSRPTPDEVYTGNGFDASQSGATGTDAQDHTLSVAGGIIDNYVIIECTVSSVCDPGASATTTCSLKFETQENPAGGYTSRFDHEILKADPGMGLEDSCRTIRFYYAPTAGEKTNGLDVKITATCVVATHASATASITNVQTVIWAH